MGNVALNQQICNLANADEDDISSFWDQCSEKMDGLSLRAGLHIHVALKLCPCIVALTAVSFMPLPVTHIMLSNVEPLCKSCLHTLRSRAVLYVQCCSGRCTQLQRLMC